MVCLHYRGFVGWLKYSFPFLPKWLKYSLPFTIQTEITDSVALIADLTGNRGGVYFEAGIARGLQLCNHPIKLFLTCERKFFENERVHFDVSGDNILLYDSVDDLTRKLRARLSAVLKVDDMR